MKRVSSLLVSFVLFAATAAAQESQWIAFESLDPNTQIVVEQNSSGPIQGAFERATADTLFVRVAGDTMSVPRPDIQLVRRPRRTGSEAPTGALGGFLVGMLTSALLTNKERGGINEFTYKPMKSPDWTAVVIGSGLGVGIGALIGSRYKWERGGDTIYDCTAPGFLDTRLRYAAWRSLYSSRASLGVRYASFSRRQHWL